MKFTLEGKYCKTKYCNVWDHNIRDNCKSECLIIVLIDTGTLLCSFTTCMYILNSRLNSTNTNSMLKGISDFFLGHWSFENYFFYIPKFAFLVCKQLDLFKFAIGTKKWHILIEKMVIGVNLTGHRPVCYGPVCYSTLFLQYLSSKVNFSDRLYKLNALI